MKARRGRFIVLEGIDGAGTTTQTSRLAAALGERGVPVVRTCEPTSGPVGRLLREVLARRVALADAAGVRGFSAATLALLFAADRLDHVGAVIEPALAGGSTVLSDRYVLSSLAYQSATAEEGERLLGWIREVNRFAPAPDLVVVLELPVEEAERRRWLRGGEPELYEHRDLQRRLGELYRRAEELAPDLALVHLDADGPVEAVTLRLLRLLEERFPELRGD